MKLAEDYTDLLTGYEGPIVYRQNHMSVFTLSCYRQQMVATEEQQITLGILYVS